MNPFVNFMVAPIGRITRAVAGAVVLGAGLLAVPGVAGDVLSALGVVPLAAGVLDICVFAPVFRLPWSGARIRLMR